MKIITKKKLHGQSAVLLLFSAMVLCISSCVKDNFELDKLKAGQWNPNIAVPLVYSSLTIEDLLTKHNPQSLIVVGSDKFCTLIYRGNLLSKQASDLIVIPDQHPPAFTASLSGGQISAFSFAGTITVPYSQTINFNSNGPSIDSATFKTGTIALSLNSDFRYSGQIKIIIPGAKKNGVAFSQILPINYTGTVPVISNVSFDIGGYNFDMTNGGTTVNQFTANFELTLTGTGAPVSPTDQISLTQSITNMQFGKIFGDIGQMSLSPGTDSIDISIFKSALGTGSFTLVDPRLKIILANSYGVPISASFSQLEGYTPGVGVYPINGSPSQILLPTPTFSQVGQVLTDSFTLDNTDPVPNIATVINNTPKLLIYQLSAQTNPQGGSTHNNFVLDTSRIKVDMEAQLPLYGTASDFVLVDTMPFKISSALPDQVESALVRTYNSNGFPLDVNLQVYFVDSLYTKLDSLIENPTQAILKSGIVNSITGIVTSPSNTVYDATLTKSRLLNLKTSKYLLIKAVANTTNGGATNVKIYSNYKLDVKLGLQVQLKVKI